MGKTFSRGFSLTTMVSSFSGVSWMVMRSISWLRPSTLLRKRGADDLDMGMGIRMVLGIGDCKTRTHRLKVHSGCVEGAAAESKSGRRTRSKQKQKQVPRNNLRA